ncbi:hypothetical protein P7C70_g2450, partial [Phenoliferia sp. Uapishka_3]
MSPIPSHATAVLSVYYPRGEKFDMDYYLQKHMAVCAKEWGSALLGYTVSTFAEGEYSVVTQIFWESKETLGAALGSSGTANVMGDIANFTDVKPTTAIGSLVARS